MNNVETDTKPIQYCGAMCIVEFEYKGQFQYPLCILPKGHEGAHKTSPALRACAEWLAYCRAIGWGRDSLDRLEELWWKYHDGYGRLRGVKERAALKEVEG